MLVELEIENIFSFFFVQHAHAHTLSTAKFPLMCTTLSQYFRLNMRTHNDCIASLFEYLMLELMVSCDVCVFFFLGPMALEPHDQYGNHV